MQHPIVKIEHLSHRYNSTWAIRDINLEIYQTGIVGLLGSNGAGKSTTMNILCGVLNQTEGSVYIDGVDIRQQPENAKKLLGFLPQSAPLHLELTVKEYLTYCAFIRNVDKQEVKQAVSEVMEKCGVTHFSSRILRNLSGGYRQRVGIAQAIIHKPKLVVLDEPTNGLDPNQILEVRKLIKEIAEERAVIFSTHILSEVQAICKDIRMIESGRMVFSDTMDAFNNYILPDTMLVFMDNPP
jgi:ABC-2 type transport system ATP-binding protein